MNYTSNIFEKLLIVNFLWKKRFKENLKNFKHVIVFYIYSFIDKETGTDILSHDTHFLLLLCR